MKFEDISKIQLEETKQNLENGVPEEDTGPLSGYSRTTYFRWKKEIPEFEEFVEKAILTYKKKLINAMNLGTIKDGKLALEILKTRWPKQWKEQAVNINLFNKEEFSW